MRSQEQLIELLTGRHVDSETCSSLFVQRRGSCVGLALCGSCGSSAARKRMSK